MINEHVPYNTYLMLIVTDLSLSTRGGGGDRCGALSAAASHWGSGAVKYNNQYQSKYVVKTGMFSGHWTRQDDI